MDEQQTAAWLETASEVEIVHLLIEWMRTPECNLGAPGRAREVVLRALEARAQQLRAQ